MNQRRMSLVTVFALILMIPAPLVAKTKAQKQADIRKQSQQVLAKLYTARPSAKATIKASAGYATFSNFGMKILIAGGGKGQGMAVDNATQNVTYMKMLEVQAGLGVGVKKFHTIFVFETKDAMDHFVNNGWEFGGEATAAATTSDQKYAGWLSRASLKPSRVAKKMAISG